MEIRIDGELSFGVSGKDVILETIGRIGTDGGTGYAVEYTGSCIRGMSMEQRMTVCNMSIEAGARAGMIAPDDTTYAYLRDKPFAPQGEDFDKAVEQWKTLPSDSGAKYDNQLSFDAADISPQVTWGTSPGMVLSLIHI